MGAPIGNKNAAKGKRWAAAIERALERRVTNKPAPTDVSDLIRGLDAAADLYVAEMFEKKDLAYFKEFGDRMDGKAAAELSVEHSGAVAHEHSGLPETARWLEDLSKPRAEPLPH